LNPNSKLEQEGYDATYLEFLVKKQIDSVRISKGLESLVNDSICFRAAQDHSKYMTKLGKLTHSQDRNAQKKTPQKRVEFFGGTNYFAGENVLYTPFDTDMYYSHDRRRETHFVGNYGRVAYDVMMGWVNSPGHFQNIVSKDYEITGLAVEVDWTEKNVYVTQVFAEVHGKYIESDWGQLFPYQEELKKKARALTDEKGSKKSKVDDVVWRKIPWGLKVPTKKKHCRGSRSDLLKGEQVKPQRMGDKMALCVYDLYKFRRLVQRRRDGLAFEFLSFAEAYSCEDGSVGLKRNQSNVQSPIQGFLQKPIYKKEILRQVNEHISNSRGKKRQRNQCFNIVIGDIPIQYRERKTEVRLVWIQRKRICEVIQFQPICGSFLDHDPPKIPLSIEVKPDSNFRPSQAPEVFEFLIPFAKGFTDFDRKLLNPLFELLSSKDVIVRKAKIEAFASLEGSFALNTQLFRKRAEHLVDAIVEVQRDSIPTEVIAKENWKDFFKDVKDSDYKFLLKLDSTEIKAYLDQNAHKLEHILKDHRYTAAKFYVYQRLNEQNTSEFAVDEYNARTLELAKKKKLPKLIVARMEKIQNFLFWKGLSGDSNWQNLYIPKTKAFADFAFRQAMFTYEHSNVDVMVFYESLKELEKAMGTDKDYLYSVSAHILNNKQHPYLGELLSKAKLQYLLDSEHLEKAAEEEVRLLYHFINANSIFIKYGGRNLRRAKGSLAFIKKYFDGQNLDKSKRIELASYFVLFHQNDWAAELLRESALSENPDPEELSFYLKILAFQDVEASTQLAPDVLLKSKQSLGRETWCDLFLGPCNINFQIFEDQNVLQEYCESCR